MKRPEIVKLDARALAELEQRIEQRVTSRILAQLATALGAASEEPYSTRGGDRHAPPEYQGRAKRWRHDAPSIPGAQKVSRWWTVPRSVYRAWLATGGAERRAAAHVANDASSAPWTPASEYRPLAGGSRR